MAKSTCSVEDCEREPRTKRMCQMHYMRFWKHGSAADPTPYVDPGCSVDGCGRPHRSLGLCDPHYKRDYRLRNPTRVRPTREEYFWSKVEKSDPCWSWSGQKNLQGYAKIGDEQAHRFSYELLVGPIPEGMQIDHMCHNPLCVKPEHLRPVTCKQNNEHRQSATRRSKSGVRGVSWDKARQKWAVHVVHERRAFNGGRYESIEEAEQAAIALRNELFTHNDIDRGKSVA